MNAMPMQDMIKVQSMVTIEGQTIATVDCRDFEHYQKLPDAIQIGNALFGKTGWNSDSCYACYKTGILLAKKI